MIGRSRWRLSLLAIGLVAGAITFGVMVRAGNSTEAIDASLAIPEGERAPAGTRIKIAVLNASTTRGLARRASAHLRDRGFDVVEIGNAPVADRRDSTLVIDRSGNPEWAERVARAFGGSRVVVLRDSSRYLDITVLVGATWRPPAKPFYP